jgi:iron-sulfur cluster assembly protein
MSEVNEVTTTTPIHLTDGAAEELKKIREGQGIDKSYGLRVGVKGGGCSGFSYILGFDGKKQSDQEFEVKGIRILMEKAHAIHLVGMEIDFIDSLNNRGFTFNNPNASETCGCGTSFAT